MNYKTMAAEVGVCALAIAGCVSIDGMRTQLQSEDKAQVATAESQVSTIVSTGVAGIQAISADERIRYAQLLNNQIVLLKTVRDIMAQGPRVLCSTGEYGLGRENAETLKGVLSLVKFNDRISQGIVGNLQYFGDMDDTLKEMVSSISDEAVLLKWSAQTAEWRDPIGSEVVDKKTKARIQSVPRGFQSVNYGKTIQHTWPLIHEAAMTKLVEVSTNRTLLVQIAAGRFGEQDITRARKAFARVDKIMSADEVEMLLNRDEYFEGVLQKSATAALVTYMLSRDGDVHRLQGTAAQNMKMLQKIHDAETLVKIARAAKDRQVRSMAKDALKACTKDANVDDFLEREIKANETDWEWLAPVFKDKNRLSGLASQRLDAVVKTGKNDDITRAWRRYGRYISDDEKLFSLSVSQMVLRRLAFDAIASEAVKAKALAIFKAELDKQLKALEEKEKKSAGLIAEIGNGEELIAYLKGKSNQTELKNEEIFSKLKGRTIVLRGTVKNIGSTMFTGKPYVSLRVAKAGMFNHIDVQFNVQKAQKGVVTSWTKDEVHILRGRLTSEGDLEDDAACENAEIISEERYAEAVSLKDEIASIKWQLKELDEKKCPPMQTKPSKFGSAVKAAANWLKSNIDDVKASEDDLKGALEFFGL